MDEVTACGICGSRMLVIILDMGMQPLAEGYRNGDLRYPLRLLECQVCTLVQLSHMVEPARVFPPDHPYATGNSGALRRHFSQLARDLEGELGLSERDLVVDIGANDGTLLMSYTRGERLVAVEPTDQAAKCRREGIRTYQEFFSASLGGRIRDAWGPARVVTATNVLAHVPDVQGFMAGVAGLLGDDGVFVTENHDLASITEGLQIDTVYHEHLRYYTVTSLARLLAQHGLVIRHARSIDTHGGSFRVSASRQRTDAGLKSRALAATDRLDELLRRVSGGEDETVYGVGATTRATPLIHYADIAHHLACVCEVSSSEKIGLVMPGTKIPIVDEARLIEDQPPYALVFSWHMASGIMTSLRLKGYKGKFIIPLPEARIVE